MAVHLFLDFDGTITTTDTLAVVAAVGYSKNPQLALRPWASFSSAYLSDLAVHKADYKPRIADRKSLAQEVAWLESLKPIERASIERVETARIFAHVTTADFRGAARQAAGAEVQLRSGLAELVMRSDIRTSVISVNWSRAFIEEFLCAALNGERETWEVHANEISDGRMDRYFGEDGGIWTVEGKSRVLRGILRDREKRTSVYIGDSLTDLGCLMLTDVGICIRDEVNGGEQRALRDALKRLKIPCRWIGEYQKQMGGVDGKVLWWAQNFTEVVDSALFAR